MGIRSSLGLGITIIVLKLLMGDTFSALEFTIAQFFVLSGELMANVSSAL